jgi:DNA-binding transcriptional ArsR family regulator
MTQKRWTEQLKAIRSQDPELAENLSTLRKKARTLQGEGNVYGESYSPRQVELSIGSILETEAQRANVLKALRKAPQSVKDLAEELGLDPQVVVAHIVELRRRNHIMLHHREGRTPFYRALAEEDR